jgi:hypothetical protein
MRLEIHHHVVGSRLSSSRVNSCVIFAQNTQVCSTLCTTISSTSASFKKGALFLDALYINYCRLGFNRLVLRYQACWWSRTSQCWCSHGTCWMFTWHMLFPAHPFVIRLLSFFLANTLGVKWGGESDETSGILFALALTHFLSPRRPSHHISVFSLFEMTNILHSQCVGYPVLWYSVPDGHAPMRAWTLTSLCLAGCQGTTFAAS